MPSIIFASPFAGAFALSLFATWTPRRRQARGGAGGRGAPGDGAASPGSKKGLSRPLPKGSLLPRPATARPPHKIHKEAPKRKSHAKRGQGRGPRRTRNKFSGNEFLTHDTTRPRRAAPC